MNVSLNYTVEPYKHYCRKYSMETHRLSTIVFFKCVGHGRLGSTVFNVFLIVFFFNGSWNSTQPFLVLEPSNVHRAMLLIVI